LKGDEKREVVELKNNKGGLEKLLERYLKVYED